MLQTDDGCDSMVIRNLLVLDNVETSMDSVLCPGGIVTFGNSIISEAGTYTESFVGANGCDSTVVLNLTIGEAGIAPCISVSIEEELLETIEIFPNPVQSDLIIKSPNVKLNQIRLINLTGQVIQEIAYTKGTEPDQTSINMATMTPGVYWVLIQTEYGLRQEKVVKF